MRTFRLMKSSWRSSARRGPIVRLSRLVPRVRSPLGSPATAGVQTRTQSWAPAFAGERSDMAELQTWMLDSIVNGAATREAVRTRIAGDARLGPEGRFAIYAGGYRSRLTEALRDDY